MHEPASGDRLSPEHISPIPAKLRLNRWPAESEPNSGFLHFSTTDILNCIFLGGFPVQCWMFRGIPGLHLLMLVALSPSMTTRNISRHCQISPDGGGRGQPPFQLRTSELKSRCCFKPLRSGVVCYIERVAKWFPFFLANRFPFFLSLS